MSGSPIGSILPFGKGRNKATKVLYFFFFSNAKAWNSAAEAFRSVAMQCSFRTVTRSSRLVARSGIAAAKGRRKNTPTASLPTCIACFFLLCQTIGPAGNSLRLLDCCHQVFLAGLPARHFTQYIMAAAECGEKNGWKANRRNEKRLACSLSSSPPTSLGASSGRDSFFWGGGLGLPETTAVPKLKKRECAQLSQTTFVG